MEWNISQSSYHVHRKSMKAKGTWSKLAKKEIKEKFKPSPLAGDFELVEMLGHGGYSEVVMASPKKDFWEKKFVAIKIIKACENVDAVLNEVECMTIIHHRNVLGLLGAFYDKTPYFVMELADGTLKELNYLNHHARPLTHWNDYNLFDVMDGILQGLKIIHDHHILHLDLKPENILMFTGVPKISDFGVAIQIKGPLVINRKVRHVKLYRVRTTQTYSNYEGCSLKSRYDKETKTTSKYATASVKTDLYSVGATIFECLRGYNLIKPGEWAYRDYEVYRSDFWDKAHIEGRMIEISGEPSTKKFFQRNPLKSRLQCVAEPWYGVLELLLDYCKKESQIVSVDELRESIEYYELRNDVEKEKHLPYTAELLPIEEKKVISRSETTKDKKNRLPKYTMQYLNREALSEADTQRLALECYYMNKDGRKVIIKTQMAKAKKERGAGARARVVTRISATENAEKHEKEAEENKLEVENSNTDAENKTTEVLENDVPHPTNTKSQKERNAPENTHSSAVVCPWMKKSTKDERVRVKGVSNFATKLEVHPKKYSHILKNLARIDPGWVANISNTNVAAAAGIKRNLQNSNEDDSGSSELPKKGGTGVKRGKYQPQEGYKRNKEVKQSDGTIRFECPICKETFKNDNHCSRHKYEKHLYRNRKPFVCPCGTGFTRRDGLKKHGCSDKPKGILPKEYELARAKAIERKQMEKEVKLAAKKANPVKRGRPKKSLPDPEMSGTEVTRDQNPNKKPVSRGRRKRSQQDLTGNVMEEPCDYNAKSLKRLHPRVIQEDANESVSEGSTFINSQRIKVVQKGRGRPKKNQTEEQNATMVQLSKGQPICKNKNIQ